MRSEDRKTICSVIDAKQEELHEISEEIWQNPECMFEENYAHTVLTDALEKYGFNVEKHYLLDTAFRADYCKGVLPKHTFAILCEYDALPIIRHGNGHNLVSEAAIAAALGVKAVLEKDPSIYGKIVVLGCPAKENGGGKIHLANNGAFDDIEAAFILHPKPINLVAPTHGFRIAVHVTYKGKEPHTTGFPWEGCNALDAAVSCYFNVSLLKHHTSPLSRIVGTITKGGESGNVFPMESKLEFIIRAPTSHEIQELSNRLKLCVSSGAEATGCSADITFHDEYIGGNVNEALSAIYKECGEEHGIAFMDDKMNLKQIIMAAGATDTGNISTVLPTLNAFFKIGNKQMNHTKAFNEVAGSISAQEPTLMAAKTLAMTIVKLFRGEDLIDEMHMCFDNDTGVIKEL